MPWTDKGNCKNFIVFGEASDLVERPKEWVNRWSYPYKGAQSPVITNAPVHGWGTHWYLVL